MQLSYDDDCRSGNWLQFFPGDNYLSRNRVQLSYDDDCLSGNWLQFFPDYYWLSRNRVNFFLMMINVYLKISCSSIMSITVYLGIEFNFFLVLYFRFI